MPSHYYLLSILTAVLWCEMAIARSTAWDATVWRPADNDTSLLFNNPGPADIRYGFYDYDETSQRINRDAYFHFISGDQIRFFQEDGAYFASNDSAAGSPVLPLGISNWFVIGADNGTGCVFDNANPTMLGRDIHQLEFGFNNGDNGLLIQSGAKIAGGIATAVPLPPAGLLLPAGLAILTQFRRLKQQR
ncbi:MAG TPA: hypothetical protein VIR60_04330 [Gammaproteobacteria bacterium]